MKKTEPAIVVGMHIEATPLACWNALTNRTEMIQWYFNNIDHFEARIGSRSSFTIEHEGRSFTHQWQVVQAAPPEIISYLWSYPEYDGLGLVSFSILPLTGNDCAVTVINEIKEDFPDDITEFNRESCRNGWIYFLDRLKSFLESD